MVPVFVSGVLCHLYLVRIIEITDEVINTWADVNELEIGQIGEITVAGPTTTQRYFAREEANQLAKIEDVDLGMNVHRMGDVGISTMMAYFGFVGARNIVWWALTTPIFLSPSSRSSTLIQMSTAAPWWY